MNNDTLSFDLIDIIRTTEDKVQFLSELDQVFRGIFSHETNVSRLLEQNLPYWKKEKLLRIAGKNTYMIQDVQTLQAFLEKVKSVVANLPEIMLTLAFAPTQEMVATISGWLTYHAKKPMILNVSVDTTLIGGVIIGYNGMHKDFSVKKKLKEKYEKGELKFL